MYRRLFWSVLLVASFIAGQGYCADPNVVDPNIVEPNNVAINTAPTANAGADQTVFADYTKMALVSLDGSASTDSEGDTLSFKWTWTLNGQVCESNEVDPDITLPVGQHVISLVVHDGNLPSAIDQITVTVVGAVKAPMKMTPSALQVKSKGNFVKARFVLPKAEIAIADVNTKQIATMEPFGLPSQKITVNYEGKKFTIITVQFDRGTLNRALANTPSGNVALTVQGKFTDGQYFYGTDSVKVINKMPKTKLVPVKAKAKK